MKKLKINKEFLKMNKFRKTGLLKQRWLQLVKLKMQINKKKEG